MADKNDVKRKDVKVFVKLKNGNQEISVRKDRVEPWLKCGYKEK